MQMMNRQPSEFTEKVITIKRVSKVTKGGKKMSFSALVVVGDNNGRVGWALGKANEVAEAIKKGLSTAKKNMITICMRDTTIPYAVIGAFSASRVVMKPALPGTGIIAGGAVRAVCEAAGIKDILTKSIGSKTSINVLQATFEGLENIKDPEITQRELKEGLTDETARTTTPEGL